AQLVLGGRAAGRRRELIPPQGSDRLARRKKEIPGVKPVVSQEFPQCAVKLVGSRLGDDVDDRAAAGAELRRVMAHLNTELLNRIHRRTQVPAIEKRLFVVGAVQLV